ncbi:MAG: glycosyltransferase [Gammaproteobacteria bacterium]|jgi:hypothetical protein|nr:glycosyltransferase [Gammaproteobacteria bacterium]
MKHWFQKSKKRSVVFYRQSYYHFYYLAQALRKRGWDAIVVNLEPSDGINANYYHGEDINLYQEDPIVFEDRIKKFFTEAKSRFQLMHFAGDGYLCFFPAHSNNEAPPDILEWKSLGKKVAYTISGCNSGMSKTRVGEWSVSGNGLNVCDTCIWQNCPEVCNDEKNLNWGKKINQYCDMIFSETSPAIDYMKSGANIIREPLSMCLDSEFWHPELNIPREYFIEKEPNEVIIYHAVGNYEIRHTEQKNIKGTPFIFSAVEQLKREGFKIHLIFITQRPNKIVRFYQAQADIIIDQLNYGRYGATAREGMMLGKPVICYMNKFEFNEQDKLQSLAECPLISATEQTIYDVLKSLIINAEKRRSIGIESRAYALKWHSAEQCAKRYEEIYDKLFGHK